MVSTIAPLLSSIEDAVEAILLTAHKEDFGQEENSKQPPCSPYMKELQAFLERISKDFLQHFTCKVKHIDGEGGGGKFSFEVVKCCLVICQFSKENQYIIYISHKMAYPLASVQNT